jgi:hypothetical protein
MRARGTPCLDWQRYMSGASVMHRDLILVEGNHDRETGAHLLRYAFAANPTRGKSIANKVTA